MIKFFRHLRQRLLTKNKFSKYLLYAIGEIILVVIGILIALQISNWNEDNKNRFIEIETLKSLKLDLISSKEQLESKRRASHNRVLYDSIVLIHLRTPQAKIDQDSLNYLVPRFKAPPTFDPEEGIITEVVSTGKLNIIANKKIRAFITAWNKNINEIKEIEGALNNLLKDKKEPYLFHHFSYRNSTNDEGKTSLRWNGNEVLSDIHFENLMIMSIVIHRTLRFRQQYFITLISEIINEIDKELKPII